jgi:hypothetical protein
MKVYAAVLVILLLIPCAVAGADHQHNKEFTKHYEDSMFMVTDKKLFSVEMVIKGKEPFTGVNTIDLIIHNREDKDVTGASITVTPWMPDMGHGVFEKPVVTEKGGGLYTVDNVIFIMSGHWELRVDVSEKGQQDRAVFDLPDVKVAEAGGHEHHVVTSHAPADLDLSRTRMSEHKSFAVTYQSDLDPIPINKIHSWKLKIESADGKPVTGAKVTIDGDMPEHGHGLPTQPEVTEELGNGMYLVGGMKFSMPGWWTIKFYISTPDKSDAVSFNLLLEE